MIEEEDFTYGEGAFDPEVVAQLQWDALQWNARIRLIEGDHSLYWNDAEGLPNEDNI